MSATQLPPNGHMAAVNGIQMYYETHGEGPPLVLLHYVTGTSQTWEPFIPDLSREFGLIIPDLRGHGRSTNPGRQWSIRQTAIDTFALLDQLGIERFKAIGLSTGAEGLLHMATQQPARVEAMVVVGGSHYWPEPCRAICRRVKEEGRWNWDELRQRHVHGDDQIQAQLDWFYACSEVYDDTNFTPPFLATITAKTLIINGDRDAYFPVSLPVEMYTSIPNAYLWIVPNGGHMPIRDQHDAFIRTTLAFLRGEWDK